MLIEAGLRSKATCKHDSLLASRSTHWLTGTPAPTRATKVRSHHHTICLMVLHGQAASALSCHRNMHNLLPICLGGQEVNRQVQPVRLQNRRNTVDSDHPLWIQKLERMIGGRADTRLLLAKAFKTGAATDSLSVQPATTKLEQAKPARDA